jgi:YHS domain-containing protein
MLGAVIGCAGEEDANPKSTPANYPTSPPPTAQPSAPPTSKSEPEKKVPSSEMTPAPAPAIKEAPKATEPGNPPKVEGPKEGASLDGSPAKLTAEELAAIKELPAAEQAVAIKQAICPVSNHHLGSMEKPLKVTAEGRTFYLCCEGCEEELKANPKAVVAKLDAKAAK